MRKLIFAALLLVALPLSPEEKPFVIGRMVGRFGNQLFQIAATVSLARDHGAQPLFPDFLLPPDPDFYNYALNYRRVFSHLDAHFPDEEIEALYVEPSFHFSPIPYQPNMVIQGWFQSEKYFKHHREEILSLFAPPPDILAYLNQKYSDFIHHPKSVSIHVRAYQKENPNNHLVYAQMTMDYYLRAISLFPEDSLFLIFSDDISWCKKEFSSLSRTVRFIEGEEYFYDFHLMSLCKDNIICNSTFSWWAAYLNRNPMKRVIAPRTWFNPHYLADAPDLIPEGWIVLPSA